MLANTIINVDRMNLSPFIILRPSVCICTLRKTFDDPDVVLPVTKNFLSCELDCFLELS
jgi:hypothetical protein